MTALPKLFVSFSGGRTSGRMAYELKTHYTKKYDMRFGFANTGKEREETLEFVERCDKEWGLNLVWVEAVVHMGEKRSSTHRVVTYETASRKGEPFVAVIRKYGIPNQAFSHCTRELKLNPIKSYLASIGWSVGSYVSAVGIRSDEPDRVREDAVEAHIVYPLVNWFPRTKPEINDWWDEQPFNLCLQEHEGNCDCCWKKSTAKLVRIAQEAPSRFDWWAQMEKQYPYAGAGHGNGHENPRTFFRQHMCAESLLTIAGNATLPPVGDQDANSGCSESCEVFGE